MTYLFIYLVIGFGVAGWLLSGGDGVPLGGVPISAQPSFKVVCMLLGAVLWLPLLTVSFLYVIFLLITGKAPL